VARDVTDMGMGICLHMRLWVKIQMDDDGGIEGCGCGRDVTWVCDLGIWWGCECMCYYVIWVNRKVSDWRRDSMCASVIFLVWGVVVCVTMDVASCILCDYICMCNQGHDNIWVTM